MPLTKTLELIIGNYNIDLGNIDDLGFKISYLLEEPENFLSKQGADAQFLSLPATISNDKAFNTFWNPQVADASPAALSYRELMPCIFNVNGTVPILTGYAVIEDATGTDKPEQYNISVFGTNGSWVIDLQNVTLWDCVNPNTHTFDVATVQGSWTGFGTTPDHDFVYAPVRYRQPFDGTTLGYGGDNCVNIYHLRPSISLLRLIQRAFNSIGFQLNSQVDPSNTELFFNTDYFKNLVLPWTWGDFYDLNSQLIQGVGFQVAGSLPNVAEAPPSTPTTIPFWSGSTSGNVYGSAGGSSWWGRDFHGGYNGSTYSGGVESIDNGIEYNTVIATADVGAGGTGYVVGDIGTITNVFGDLATYRVTSVSGGVATGITITFGGTAYPTGTYSEGYHAGKTCATVATSGVGTGLTILILTNSVFHPVGTGITSDFNYIFSGSGSSPAHIPAGVDVFNMLTNFPPNGYDNFLLYSFDAATGTMQYDFNPPASLAGTMSNIAITFVIDLYALITTTTFAHALLGLECLHVTASGNILTCQSIMPDGLDVSGGTHYPTSSGFPTTPTTANFTIPNCNPGDTLKFRLTALVDSSSLGATFGVFTGGYLNNNPTVIGVPSYSYNPVTEQYAYTIPNSIWSPLYSKLTMTGFLTQLGNSVNLKDYDAFRNYQVLDMIGGVIDLFNIEVQTDNINKVVTMEPMLGSTLPTGEVIDGYFSVSRILDYSAKQDNSSGKGTKVSLFKSVNRQVDLTFKLDGNDGSQNIWAQRYKGVYLNDRTYTGGINQNNINIDNGIIAGIPGAARYEFPNRFAKGNQQISNRFFSALLHVTMPQWIDINGTASPATQIPCIFSGNTNSDTAYKDVFTPKLAWYAGQSRPIADTGGWLWIGNPASPTPTTSAPLPFMFSVNYGKGGATDPMLSYCDESVRTPGGAVVQGAGLQSQFYRARFAIMRNGQLVTKYLRLNLNDICNWTHQECIIIDGCLYAIIQIEGFDPLKDDSTAVTMWKIANVEQVDIDNSFPSATSIAAVNNPTVSLGSSDLRYAKLLLYPTDLPQIG